MLCLLLAGGREGLAGGREGRARGREGRARGRSLRASEPACFEVCMK